MDSAFTSVVKSSPKFVLRRSKAISSSWLLMAGLSLGCQAQEIAAPPAPVPLLPTHRLMPAPPLLTTGRSLLWVALDDHLGQETEGIKPAPSLQLKSAGQPLLLRDARGEVHRSLSITLSWKQVSLDTPHQFARYVAGPFASFESAERVAMDWRQAGVDAVVAHPNDWQVWAPLSIRPPEEVPFQVRRETVARFVQPVLQLPDGAITLAAPLEIEAPDGLDWQGGVYRGPFRLQPDAYGSWTLVEQVPLESYLLGVVPHEIGAGAPVAALMAQTVLARTWALANRHRFAVDGYHLCSDTQCQVYRDPRQASVGVRQAITTTAGKVLSWQGQPISAVYHASNGGVMAAGSEAWSMDSVPYLRAQLDGPAAWAEQFAWPLVAPSSLATLLQVGDEAYGSAHVRFRWQRTLTAAQIQQALQSLAPGLALPQQLTVSERGASGRVLALEIRSSETQPPVVLRLDSIRRHLRQLPSTLFVIKPESEGIWRFTGGGFGHGAGLSQAGAIDLAFRGWSTEQILSHYYPGTMYGPLPQIENAH